jgi:hypothetical protein
LAIHSPLPTHEASSSVRSGRVLHSSLHYHVPDWFSRTIFTDRLAGGSAVLGVVVRLRANAPVRFLRDASFNELLAKQDEGFHDDVHKRDVVARSSVVLYGLSIAEHGTMRRFWGSGVAGLRCVCGRHPNRDNSLRDHPWHGCPALALDYAPRTKSDQHILITARIAISLTIGFHYDGQRLPQSTLDRRSGFSKFSGRQS